MLIFFLCLSNYIARLSGNLSSPRAVCRVYVSTKRLKRRPTIISMPTCPARPLKPAPPFKPIIVDTSVAVKWLFDEPLATQALRLRQMFQEGSHYPLAPDLFACGDLGPIDEHLPFWPALLR